MLKRLTVIGLSAALATSVTAVPDAQQPRPALVKYDAFDFMAQQHKASIVMLHEVGIVPTAVAGQIATLAQKSTTLVQ